MLLTLVYQAPFQLLLPPPRHPDEGSKARSLSHHIRRLLQPACKAALPVLCCCAHVPVHITQRVLARWLPAGLLVGAYPGAVPAGPW